ncbi:uncharacterized protein LOC101847103 [Aplysia californica]|uniref:Uncharacterized protein LOC101847103 n=1 Tax=Aplysia californica TaxID=6500 RepID=A0ABM0JMH4_APLCA|nr:uncharacterized protein LOC101847103 [Aplysia californica]
MEVHRRTMRAVVVLLFWLSIVFGQRSRPREDYTLDGECLKDDLIKQNERLSFCLNGSNLAIGSQNLCVNMNQEKIYIKSFAVYFPKKSDLCKSISVYTHKMSIASCIHKKDPGMARDIVMPFFNALSGRTPAELVHHRETIQSPFVLSKMKPKPDSISLDYECLGSSRVYDICENVSTEISSNLLIQLIFKNETFSAQPESSSCSCQITSRSNNSAEVTLSAYDIRISKGMSLNIHGCDGTNRVTISDEKLRYYLDGKLCTSSSVMTLSLSGVNPNFIPDSIWAGVKGTDLTITCGKQFGEDKTFLPGVSDSEDGSLGTVYILCIVVGAVLIIVLLLTVAHCVRKRLRSSGKYVTDSSLSDGEHEPDVPNGPNFPMEVIYSQPHKPAHSMSKDESEEKLLKGETGLKQDEYFELENQYEETGPGNNNYKGCEKENSENNEPEVRPYSFAHQISAPLQKAPIPLPRQESRSSNSGIYNHLREQPDVAPQNIYDSSGKDDYSSFQREAAPTLTDNIYDKA